MCLDDSHEYAKKELFEAVRLFMARNKIASAILKDGEIMMIFGERKTFKELVEFDLHTGHTGGEDKDNRSTRSMRHKPL